MKNTLVKYSIVITFIWIGFVCAISFMEAWLKFRAPGITTELGLGVGQLVFKALNRVELVCGVLLLIGFVFLKIKYKTTTKSCFFLLPVVAILLLQTLWMLPALDHRATLRIAGAETPKSYLHLWYVVLEILKVVNLICYGIQLFSIQKAPHRTINTSLWI